MKKVVRNVLASAISVALLAGCSSDDKKDDPVYGEDGITGEQGPNGPIKGEDGNTGNVGPGGPVLGDQGPEGPQGKPGSFVILYGQGADTDFHLAATDKLDALDLVDSDGEVRLENVTTQPLVEGERDSGLNISITDGSGSILTQSTSDQGIDLSTQSHQGTLQFDIKVNSNPSKDDVAVILSDESEGSDIVDITSAVTAFTGAATQSMTIPLNCFNETDFSNIVKPFSIVTEADLDFDLSNVRYLRNTDEAQDAFECESDSSIIDSADSEIYVRYFGEDNKAVRDGWLRNTASIHPGDLGFSPRNEPELLFSVNVPAPKYDQDNGGVRPDGDVGVSFRAGNNVPNNDVSHFIESSSLSFDYRVDDQFPEEGRKLIVWLSSVDINQDKNDFRKPEFSSNAIELDTSSLKEFETFTLPLTEFFIDEDEQLDINMIRNIRNIVVETVSEGDLLETEYSRFFINNLKFIPTEES